MYTTIRGLQIRDAFFGDGLKRNAGDGDIAELDLKTNGGLKIDTYQLAVEPADFAGVGLVDNADNLDVNVDDSTIEVTSGNVVQVKNGGITETQLNVSVNASLDLADSAMQPGEESVAFIDLTDTPGAYAGNALKVVRVNAGANGLEYATLTDLVGILESAVKVENESANCNGSNTDFTLGSTPVANSIDVYLNGSRMTEGSGLDYTVAGTTVSFAIAPEADDILILRYIATA